MIARLSVRPFLGSLSRLAERLRSRVAAFLLRRPHRSFQLTRRRDYGRSLALPGYWKFTSEVTALLWRERGIFGWLVVVYMVLTAALVGLASQDVYDEMATLIKDTGDQVVTGGLGTLEEAGMIFLSTVSGGLGSGTETSQQVYAGLIGMLTWLTTVWLLRALLAGQKPRLRDGLYNAGAPILPTFIVSLVLVVQLLPLALVGLGYTAATASGLLEGGIEAMLFWAAAALLVALSLYWATSTFIALVVVTLPGMYPARALRTAGDLVVGRRVRILWRVAWALFWAALVWALVMIPMIIFDGWLKSVVPAVSWLPLVPTTLLLLGSVTIVVLAAYVYMLYRKVVEDDAAPAAN